MFKQLALIALLASVCVAYKSEFIKKAERIPTVYSNGETLPDAFDWGNVGGLNFLTKS
jgi:hypothetical protein